MYKLSIHTIYITMFAHDPVFAMNVTLSNTESSAAWSSMKIVDPALLSVYSIQVNKPYQELPRLFDFYRCIAFVLDDTPWDPSYPRRPIGLCSKVGMFKDLHTTHCVLLPWPCNPRVYVLHNPKEDFVVGAFTSLYLDVDLPGSLVMYGGMASFLLYPLSCRGFSSSTHEHIRPLRDEILALPRNGCGVAFFPALCTSIQPASDAFDQFSTKGYGVLESWDPETHGCTYADHVAWKFDRVDSRLCVGDKPYLHITKELTMLVEIGAMGQYNAQTNVCLLNIGLMHVPGTLTFTSY